MWRVVPRWMACVLAVLPLLAQAGSVVTGEIRGAIGPAGTAYLERVLSHAATVRAELVVIALDTPGGLDTSMREMIQAIIGSPVPVAIFVSPRGARAASAGTYLLYAAHVAAMAPGTNVGAATPIALGIGGGGDHAPRPEDRADGAAGGKDAGEADERAGTPRDPAKAKAMRDAAAYLQSLADMRGRSTEWARKAVVEADSLPAREALRTGVIDVVASDLPDLLRQIDGRDVEVVGTVRKLDVAGASIDSVAPNWKERFLATISNPNIALLLMMAAIYGLLIEFYVPGTAVPGVIGGISLLLGLYGLALLPVNLAGAALVVLGLMLMVAEAFAPSFGALGLGGAVAFAAGALFLLDDVPGFAVSWGLVVPVALANALVIAAVAAYAVKARKRPGVTGIEGMIGTYVEALEDFERDGWVRAHGERWRARSTGPLRRGERARITGIAGLVMAVEPSNEEGA